MKWLPFGILACITIICQTTFVPSMAIHHIWPDWMFVLAVHYALWGPWPDAAIAAWLLGLIVDLQSSDRIGLYAFSFGAAAWAIMYVRQAVFRDHPLTHVVMTLFFAFGVRLLAAFYDWWCGTTSGSFGALFYPAFFTALYTAACAPYLFWPLIRMGKWTGLRSSRDYLAGQ